jgi:hypothetical protein
MRTYSLDKLDMLLVEWQGAFNAAYKFISPILNSSQPRALTRSEAAAMEALGDRGVTAESALYEYLKVNTPSTPQLLNWFKAYSVLQTALKTTRDPRNLSSDITEGYATCSQALLEYLDNEGQSA